MAITIELSPAVEAKLRAEIVDLNGAAKLGLAVEAYRSGTLTLGQFAELLGVGQYEADGILKERGVMLDLDDEQLAGERRDVGSSLGIMIVVADASPLNYLLLIDAAHVVQPLFGEVIIPPAVQRELSHPCASAVVQAYIAQPPAWLRIAAPAAALPELDLDAGEAEAMALSVEFHADALLIDDRKGRLAATRLGLKTISTISILEAAARQNLLSLDEAFRRLLKTNFRVSPRLLAEAIKRHRRRPDGI